MNEDKMTPLGKNFALWIVVGLLMVLLFKLFNAPQTPVENDLIFSEFMTKAEKGEVTEVTIRDNAIRGVLKNGTRFKTYTVFYPDLVKTLRDQGVQITAKPLEEPSWYIVFLITWGPFILFIGLWIFFMRQMQMGGNKALSFGKSRARLVSDCLLYTSPSPRD